MGYDEDDEDIDMFVAPGPQKKAVPGGSSKNRNASGGSNFRPGGSGASNGAS